MTVYGYVVDGQLVIALFSEYAPSDAIPIEIADMSEIDNIIYDGNNIRLKTDDELKAELISARQDQLINYQKSIVNQLINQSGYLSLGDVMFYAQSNEQEAIDLLNKYDALDNAIWDFILNTLPNLTVHQLKSLTYQIDENWSFSYATE